MERISMKKYEVVTIHKGTKYQKKVIRALIRFDKEGNPIPKGDKPRAVVLGSVNDFKYTPSGNIRSLSAFEKAIHEAIHEMEENQGTQKKSQGATKNATRISALFDQYIQSLKDEKSRVTLEVRDESTINKSSIAFNADDLKPFTDANHCSVALNIVGFLVLQS